MRLTLRTLLAYLDDTLEPAETKQIGQKVAESDAAQELIARIKQVTRRRRLTTPPATGPGARFDPNTVAGYLDNTLPAEEVADLEKTCLDSDVHLAEIAAAHQILTLVLGEPALVPPTAKERMYGLVHGREALPGRKAPLSGAQRRRAEEGLMAAGSDEDDALLMGLPLYRRQSTWLRWLLPLAGIVLLGGISVAVWQALAGLSSDDIRRPRAGTMGPSGTSTGKQGGNGPDQDGGNGNAQDTPREVAILPIPQLFLADGVLACMDAYARDLAASEQPLGPWLDKPRIERVAAGKLVAGAKGVPTLVVHHQANADKKSWQGWERVPEEGIVHTADQLVALPGCRGELQLDKGISLYLWGIMPQFQGYPPAFESSVTLHASDKYDLDFTLARGRVMLTNRKPRGPARVRLRFYDEKYGKDGKTREEIWNLTLLEPDTEVGIERLSYFFPGTGSRNGIAPETVLALVVINGSVSVSLDERSTGNRLEAPPGPAFLQWTSSGPPPQRAPFNKEALPLWNKTLPGTPAAKELQSVLRDLEQNLSDKVPVDVALLQAIQSPQPTMRLEGVQCLAAIDYLPALLDALADSKESHPEVRNFAVVALGHWLGLRADNDEKLYQMLLKKYTKGEAEIIMQLLSGIPQSERRLPEMWQVLISYLEHPKLAIRQLAHVQLYRMVPQGRDIRYDPAGDDTQIKAGVRQWKQLIPDGKLPPMPPAAPPK